MKLPLMPLLCRPLLALCLAAPLTACGYGNGHDHDHDGYYDDDVDYSCGDAIEEATIDTGELLDVDAGVGAGTFVEYEGGGVYHVTTSCDADTGSDCLWDIVVQPLSGPIVSAAPADLEGDDNLSFGADEQLRLIAYTGHDFDGFTMQTEPGAGLQVDVLLDYACGNRYLFWVGDGALRGGAPSNPIELIPSAP